MPDLEAILHDFRNGNADLDETVERIRIANSERIDALTIDHDREHRTGQAEVVFGESKTPDQVLNAFEAISSAGSNVLATRVSAEAIAHVQSALPSVDYSSIAKIATLKIKDVEQTKTKIGVITAGTSDQAAAEEAALTAEFYGNPVLRVSDVGVAGIHRLFARLDEIRACRVLVVVAGMEGALPSAVGGLVDKPVIAVPTSIGYGAAFGGIAALLGMLTSCASGIAVVNIDNGFGAGFMANRINRL